jgi:hypothetical protein
MGILEDLEREIEGRGGKDHTLVAVENLEQGFSPIEGLQPGDRVKVKSDFYNVYKSFRADPENTVGIVHRVGDFSSNRDDGGPVNLDDFTILCKAAGTIHEVAFDSRRFKRVE